MFFLSFPFCTLGVHLLFSGFRSGSLCFLSGGTAAERLHFGRAHKEAGEAGAHGEPQTEATSP